MSPAYGSGRRLMVGRNDRLDERAPNRYARLVPGDTNTVPTLRAIDLFCGAGGLSEGFRQAGYEITLGVDIDEDSCRSFEANHRTAEVVNGSLAELSPSDIRRMSGGDIDVVLGGPSCQGFSTARKERWDNPQDEQNRLWIHMLKVVEELQPRAFLLENVPGLVYWKKGGFGAAMLEEFGKLGYRVTPPQILLAADYGVPQRRRRLFIVGQLRDEFVFPSQTHMGGWRRDTLELWEQRRVEEDLLRHISCWEAIGDLPMLEGSTGTQTAEYPDTVRPTPYIRRLRGRATVLRDHQASEVGEDHRRLIEHVPQGGTWRDIPRHLLPDRFRGMRRTDSSNLLGRLDPSLPSYTITTQFNNVTAGCFVHPYEDRALTVREGARLQSFPDRYRFSGGLHSRYRQVGNAVPPVLATALAHAIAEQIGKASATHSSPPIKPAKNNLPPPTTSTTRARMKRQPRRDTAPETLVRIELDKYGVRYETDAAPIPQLRRTADLVFREDRLAVFIDGCFWHGCPTHSRPTKSNTKWWAEKIQQNRERDEDTTSRLVEADWRVVRVWEHEDPVDAAARVIQMLGKSDGLAAVS